MLADVNRRQVLRGHVGGQFDDVHVRDLDERLGRGAVYLLADVDQAFHHTAGDRGRDLRP